MNWTHTIDRYLAERRSVSGAKGDKTVNATEASQGQFTKTLQSAFANNNANQQNQLSFLNQKLQSAISNPQGYSPQALAALRTQATEGAATENKNIVGAVQNKFATQGGADSLPSGVQEQIAAQTAQKVAGDESSQQLGITEQDAQLQNENQWRAIQGDTGVAQLENPSSMSSNATGAADSVAGLSDAATKANQGTLGSVLGGVVGAGLSGWASGGFKVPSFNKPSGSGAGSGGI